MVADILAVSAIIAWALGNDYLGDAGRGWSWVFDLVLPLPLLWRRRRPLKVFAAISLLALVEWLTDTPASGTLAILVALYSVGAYELRRWPVVYAAVTTQVGVVMAVWRWAPSDHRLAATALLTGTLTAAWILGVYARTRRAFLQAALDRAATAERERDQQAMLATAAERARISREMHDIVAHTLSVMVALSDGAALSVVRDTDSARDAMEQSARLGRQALGDLRRLLSGLQQPDGADLSPAPGVQDVEALVAAVRAAGLPAELVMTGRPPVMPPGLQVAAYRLIQESLTNVLKHAPAATHVTVTLAYSADAIDVEVVNDDESMVSLLAASAVRRAAQPSSEPHGRGLVGMEERAAVFGGWVEAAPRPGGGWQVRARLHVDDGAGQP